MSFHKLKSVARNRYIRIAVNLIVLGFCVFYLYTNFTSIALELKKVRFNWGWIALSEVLTIITVWTSAVAWWLLLRAFNQPVGFFIGCHAHLKSSVAKYIPGYAWQFLGKAYLTRQIGVPTKLTSMLIVWEFCLLIWSGAAVVFLTVPEQFLTLWFPDFANFPITKVIGTLLFLALIAFPFILRKGIQKFLPEYQIALLYLFASIVMILLGWFFLGYLLLILSNTFGVMQPTSFWFFVFTFSTSLIAGILAIPVPNGLGVREGIMAYFLSLIMPMPMAVFLSTIARLEIVIGDFFSALLVEAILRIHRFQRVNPSDSPLE